MHTQLDSVEGCVLRGLQIPGKAFTQSLSCSFTQNAPFPRHRSLPGIIWLCSNRTFMKRDTTWDVLGSSRRRRSKRQPGWQMLTDTSHWMSGYMGVPPYCSVFLGTHQNFLQDKSWLKSNSPYIVPCFNLQPSSQPPHLPFPALFSAYVVMILVSLPHRSEVMGSCSTIMYKPLTPTCHSRGLGQA